MKSLLLSTALMSSVTLTTTAFAQSNMQSELFSNAGAETDMHASDFIGMSVYTADTLEENNWDLDEVAGMQSDWDNVGEINDLVITRDGEITSVLVDIGGFLGMGERQVAMNMDQIRFFADSATDEPNDFFLVIPASQAELEEAPEYEGFAMRGEMGSPINAADAENDMAEAKKMDWMHLGQDEIAQLTADDLTGTRVYDAAGEWIGEVSELHLDTEGKIDAAIVDVGGFLGLGEKPVELALDDLDIMRTGGDLRVALSLTEEELEALPTWEG